MPRGLRLPKTIEEKTALKLSEIVNDYNLNLDEVGRHFARVAPLVSYNRFIHIIETAEMERENQDVRHSHHPLF
jgi:hypothetical protein